MKKNNKTESHKYLNALNISSKDPCIFNTKEKEKSRKRQKRYLEQREKYGFDERETWALNSTLIGWLYSHLKWITKHTPVDFTVYSFDIPVLKPIPKKELEWIDEEKGLAVRYYTENVKTVTQEEAMKKALTYMEYYLRHSESMSPEKERKSDEKAACALKIIAVIFPVLGW